MHLYCFLSCMRPYNCTSWAQLRSTKAEITSSSCETNVYGYITIIVCPQKLLRTNSKSFFWDTHGIFKGSGMLNPAKPLFKDVSNSAVFQRPVFYPVPNRLSGQTKLKLYVK